MTRGYRPEEEEGILYLKQMNAGIVPVPQASSSSTGGNSSSNTTLSNTTGALPNTNSTPLTAQLTELQQASISQAAPALFQTGNAFLGNMLPAGVSEALMNIACLQAAKDMGLVSSSPATPSTDHTVTLGMPTDSGMQGLDRGSSDPRLAMPQSHTSPVFTRNNVMPEASSLYHSLRNLPVDPRGMADAASWNTGRANGFVLLPTANEVRTRVQDNPSLALMAANNVPPSSYNPLEQARALTDNLNLLELPDQFSSEDVAFVREAMKDLANDYQRLSTMSRGSNFLTNEEKAIVQEALVKYQRLNSALQAQEKNLTKEQNRQQREDARNEFLDTLYTHLDNVPQEFNSSTHANAVINDLDSMYTMYAVELDNNRQLYGGGPIRQEDLNLIKDKIKEVKVAEKILQEQEFQEQLDSGEYRQANWRDLLYSIPAGYHKDFSERQAYNAALGRDNTYEEALAKVDEYNYISQNPVFNFLDNSGRSLGGHIFGQTTPDAVMRLGLGIVSGAGVGTAAAGPPGTLTGGLVGLLGTMTFNDAEHAYYTNVGKTYMDLTDCGVEHETALRAAQVVGGVHGALEMLTMRDLTGMSSALAGAAAKPYTQEMIREYLASIAQHQVENLITNAVESGAQAYALSDRELNEVVDEFFRQYADKPLGILFDEGIIDSLPWDKIFSSILY